MAMPKLTKQLRAAERKADHLRAKAVAAGELVETPKPTTALPVSVSGIEPRDGYVLTANTALDLGGVRYNRGNIIPSAAVLGANGDALLRRNFVRWTRQVA